MGSYITEERDRITRKSTIHLITSNIYVYVIHTRCDQKETGLVSISLRRYRIKFDGFTGRFSVPVRTCISLHSKIEHIFHTQQPNTLSERRFSITPRARVCTIT